MLQVDIVAPLVGAWIEINTICARWYVCAVAPLVGAWIEILYILLLRMWMLVAPLVGAWIEIGLCSDRWVNIQSLLS